MFIPRSRRWSAVCLTLAGVFLSGCIVVEPVRHHPPEHYYYR